MRYHSEIIQLDPVIYNQVQAAGFEIKPRCIPFQVQMVVVPRKAFYFYEGRIAEKGHLL